jgi:hypothetical protein
MKMLNNVERFLVVIFLTHSIGISQNIVEDPFKDIFPPVNHSADSILRSDWNLCYSAEAAWNGVVGVGAMLHFYPVPYLAIEAGVGAGNGGMKHGGRVRVILGKGKCAPFIGMGFTTKAGYGNDTTTENNGKNKVLFKLKRTFYSQFSGGIDWMTNNGFFILGNVGYSVCMNNDNIEIISGKPTDAQNAHFNLFYRGGLIIGINIGHVIK